MMRIDLTDTERRALLAELNQIRAELRESMATLKVSINRTDEEQAAKQRWQKFDAEWKEHREQSETRLKLCKEQRAREAELRALDEILWDVCGLFVAGPTNNGYEQFLYGVSNLFEEEEFAEAMILRAMMNTEESVAGQFYEIENQWLYRIVERYEVEKLEEIMCFIRNLFVAGPHNNGYERFLEGIDNLFVEHDSINKVEVIGKSQMLSLKGGDSDACYLLDEMSLSKIISIREVCPVTIGSHYGILAEKCYGRITWPTGIGTELISHESIKYLRWGVDMMLSYGSSVRVLFLKWTNMEYGIMLIVEQYQGTLWGTPYAHHGSKSSPFYYHGSESKRVLNGLHLYKVNGNCIIASYQVLKGTEEGLKQLDFQVESVGVVVPGSTELGDGYMGRERMFPAFSDKVVIAKKTAGTIIKLPAQAQGTHELKLSGRCYAVRRGFISSKYIAGNYEMSLYFQAQEIVEAFQKQWDPGVRVSSHFSREGGVPNKPSANKANLRILEEAKTQKHDRAGNVQEVMKNCQSTIQYPYYSKGFGSLTGHYYKIDKLCKDGHLEEVKSIIDNMPLKQSITSWMNLIHGSRSQGYKDTDIYATHNLIEVDPGTHSYTLILELQLLKLNLCGLRMEPPWPPDIFQRRELLYGFDCSCLVLYIRLLRGSYGGKQETHKANGSGDKMRILVGYETKEESGTRWVVLSSLVIKRATKNYDLLTLADYCQIWRFKELVTIFLQMIWKPGIAMIQVHYGSCESEQGFQSRNLEVKVKIQEREKNDKECRRGDKWISGHCSMEGSTPNELSTSSATMISYCGDELTKGNHIKLQQHGSMGKAPKVKWKENLYKVSFREGCDYDPLFKVWTDQTLIIKQTKETSEAHGGCKQKLGGHSILTVALIFIIAGQSEVNKALMELGLQETSGDSEREIHHDFDKVRTKLLSKIKRIQIQRDDFMAEKWLQNTSLRTSFSKEGGLSGSQRKVKIEDGWSDVVLGNLWPYRNGAVLVTRVRAGTTVRGTCLLPLHLSRAKWSNCWEELVGR